MSCYNELAGQGIGGENSFNKGEEENIDVDGSTKVDNVFIAEARSADSSGEDDSDEEEAGGNIEVELNIIFSMLLPLTYNQCFSCFSLLLLHILYVAYF